MHRRRLVVRAVRRRCHSYVRRGRCGRPRFVTRSFDYLQGSGTRRRGTFLPKWGHRASSRDFARDRCCKGNAQHEKCLTTFSLWPTATARDCGWLRNLPCDTRKTDPYDPCGLQDRNTPRRHRVRFPRGWDIAGRSILHRRDLWQMWQSQQAWRG